MSILGFLGKVGKTAGSLLIGKTIAPTPESIELKKQGLELLTPRAQFWTSIARPTISMALVGTLVLGTLIQFGQQLFKAEFIITIPMYMIDFTKIIVGAYIGSRGIEKILGKVL